MGGGPKLDHRVRIQLGQVHFEVFSTSPAIFLKYLEGILKALIFLKYCDGIFQALIFLPTVQAVFILLYFVVILFGLSGEVLSLTI